MTNTDPAPILPEPPPSPRAVVVGLGALGSEVCRLLLFRRVSDVLLVDPDTVAPRNIPLSRLFQQASPLCLGQPKVEIIQRFALAQGLSWRALQAEIADVGLARLAPSDVIISCTDSILARAETSFAARSLRLPMLDGAVHSNHIPEGRVSWFAAPDHAACPLCALSEARRAELLAESLAPWLGCVPPLHVEAMSGALEAVDAVAETLVTMLESRIPPASFSLRLRPGVPHQRFALTPSPTCPWHTLPLPEDLFPLPPNLPIRQSLPPGSVLDLPWPLCLRARCLRCGAPCTPMLRAARVRRTLPCPACDVSGCLQPLETVQRLTPGHPLALSTPTGLGLPAQHLYHRRRAIVPHGARKPDLP